MILLRCLPRRITGAVEREKLSFGTDDLRRQTGGVTDDDGGFEEFLCGSGHRQPARLHGIDGGLDAGAGQPGQISALQRRRFRPSGCLRAAT